jgi:hypothetical protein
LGIDTNEKMDVIGNGLKFNQLGPSLDAHLGNDFLEPSVDGAVLWIVGDNRSLSTWDTIQRDRYSGRQCCYWI